MTNLRIGHFFSGLNAKWAVETMPFFSLAVDYEMIQAGQHQACRNGLLHRRLWRSYPVEGKLIRRGICSIAGYAIR
jgi:hypothetical protein